MTRPLKRDKLGRKIWPPMNEPEKDLPPQLKTKRTKIVHIDKAIYGRIFDALDPLDRRVDPTLGVENLCFYDVRLVYTPHKESEK